MDELTLERLPVLSEVCTFWHKMEGGGGGEHGLATEAVNMLQAQACYRGFGAFRNAWADIIACQLPAGSLHNAKTSIPHAPGSAFAMHPRLFHFLLSPLLGEAWMHACSATFRRSMRRCFPGRLTSSKLLTPCPDPSIFDWNRRKRYHEDVSVRIDGVMRCDGIGALELGPGNQTSGQDCSWNEGNSLLRRFWQRRRSVDPISGFGMLTWLDGRAEV